MKFESNKKKQLERAKEWLQRARVAAKLKSRYDWDNEFTIIIAIEQLIVYLEMQDPNK